MLKLQTSSILPSEDSLSEIGDSTSFNLFIPSDLQYIDEARTCVLFEEDKEQVFKAWWCQTPWAKNVAHKTREGKSVMIWTTKGRTAPCWKQFNQIAVTSSGHPKLQCVICGTLLEHPSPKNSGINSMTRHLSRSNCKRKVIRTGAGEDVRICFSKQEVRTRDRYNNRYIN